MGEDISLPTGETEDVMESLVTEPHGRMLPYEVAQVVIDRENGVSRQYGVDLNLKSLEVSEKDETMDVIQELIKNNTQLFDLVTEYLDTDDNFIDTPFYDSALKIMMANQNDINNLEPIALEEQLKTDKTTAKIVRMNNTGSQLGSYSSTKSTVHRNGTPWLIAVANAENSSSYQQLGEIVKSIVDPLKEIDEKIDFIRCVVLNGSTVSNPSLAGDIDLLILTDEYKIPVYQEDFPEGLSDEASKLLKAMIYKKQTNMSEEFKLKFDIAGDVITKNHVLEMTFNTVGEFLRVYEMKGEDKKQLLEESRKVMRRVSPDKAYLYENVDMTYPEMVVNTGAQIIYGENFKDSHKQDVFKHKDVDLLR